MWSRFTNIFKSSATQEAAKDDLEDEMMAYMSGMSAEESIKYILTKVPELTDKSPRTAAPPKFGVKLWPHQEAMLTRCIEIENNKVDATTQPLNAVRYMDKSIVPKTSTVNIGIMNDPPGSGKTYALLAMIAADKRDGLNVIIVPQNIYAQWEKSIHTAYGTKDDAILPYKCYKSYSDIMDIHTNRPTNMKVILINELFAETIASSLRDLNIHPNRLIIDEIDSVQGRLFTPIEAKYVWLVSASFIYKDTINVGPYTINKQDVPRAVCKCTPDFILKNVPIPDPTVEKIVCDDNDVQLLIDCVDDKVITAINSGDLRLLLKSMKNQYLPTEHTLRKLAEHLSNEYINEGNAKVREYEEALEYYNKHNEDNDSGDEYQRNKYNGLLRESERLIQKGETIKARIANYTDSVRQKADIFNTDICKRIKDDPASKWLFFNDNASTLIDCQALLSEIGIRAEMMDGGNEVAIAKTIAGYKDGDIQVLLLNSRMEGAGMNLENTTHLLFMHATDPRLVDQVTGRAQRYGRTRPLHIIGLFNKNEDMDI
jgi:hypothetical protein